MKQSLSVSAKAPTRLKAFRPQHLHRGQRSPARRTTASGTFVRRIRGAACSLSTSAAMRGAFLDRRRDSIRETSGWIAVAVRTFAQTITGPGSPVFPGILPAGGSYGMYCASDSGGRVICPTAVSGGVTLARQRSNSPCIYGSTWGYDRRGIWVDCGCRADFQIGGSNWLRPFVRA